MFGKNFWAGVAATIILGFIITYAVIATGVIPANADATPGWLESWAAHTSLRATLARDAPKAANPLPPTDANLIAGVQLYAKHCAICHGTARGDASASPIAKGLYPRPPQLATDGVEDDPQGYTYWKIDHGIRWTAMPSWKGTLSSHQMWLLSLFLNHMDKLPSGPEGAWKQVTN
ncbi:MAG: cytochrome c [Alphaproteobacteria bacterium]|nr:cytochrome c [Alphaproteobacteria bacterium]